MPSSREWKYISFCLFWYSAYPARVCDTGHTIFQITPEAVPFPRHNAVLF